MVDASLSTPNLTRYWVNPSAHPLANTRGPDWWREPHALFGEVLAASHHLAPKRLLDIGCGAGNHAVTAAQAGFLVDAFDGSAEAVAFAQAKTQELGLGDSITYSVKHFATFGYPQNEYAVVLSFNAMHHDTEASFRTNLQKVHASLIEGGKFFITLPILLPSSMAFYGSQIEPHAFVPTSGHEEGIPHLLFDDAFVQEVIEPYFIVERQADGSLRQADEWHYFLALTKR